MKNTILTHIGKQTRKIRIDNEELLIDMANKLGISASYLSAIETGKRKTPDNFVSNIEKIYKITLLKKEKG